MIKNDYRLDFLKICGGTDKSGQPENIDIVLTPGEIVCIVGKTGAGKSRLLADIECLAQGDTPTGRKISVGGKNAKGGGRRLVAQISQNMNFVADLCVKDFIAMHAQSRLIASIKETVKTVINQANRLAGEKFHAGTPLGQLSGGQSRALMIADAAMLSFSPAVLIDEIENAGIDRKKALELLVKKEKITLISTHDPLLALMGNRRIVMKNGGIARVIESSPEEKENLKRLGINDNKMANLKDRLRRGEEIKYPLSFLPSRQANRKTPRRQNRDYWQ